MAVLNKKTLLLRWRHKFGLGMWLSVCYSFSSAYVKTCCWPGKNWRLQPTKDRHTGIFPKEYVLSPGLLSSGSSGFFFLVMTHAVMFAVTTVSTWLGPKRVVQKTFKVRKLCFPPKSQHHHHHPLTVKVVGEPQMISQPVSSIFPCSSLLCTMIKKIIWPT